MPSHATAPPTIPARWPTAPPAATPRPAAVITAPRVHAVLFALGAMALLTAAAALGSARLDVVARSLPLLVVSVTGALVLGAPALVVLHQFLRLDAPPEQIVAVLARAVTCGGRIALGLVPVALFFAATSGLWLVMLAASVAIPGLAMLAVAVLGLRDVETAAPIMAPRFAVLLIGWTGLTTLIAIRIAVALAMEVVR